MNSHALWYMTRATGVVALVLLTATTVLGILTAVRLSTARWPRFAWQDLHRRLSLIAVIFVGLHVATTVLDGYAPIGWLSAVVPFTSPYRRLWLGLGTVAVDLLLAVGISSILRSRIRPGTWRALHWLAYASWPLAVVHALGTGTDPRLAWVLALVAACVVSVMLAGAWRLGSGWPARAGLRVMTGAVGLVSVVAVSSWAAAGPLRPGWAAKAGTPSSLLGHSTSRATAPSGTPNPGATSPSAVRGRSASLPVPPFESEVSGTLSEHNLRGGLDEIDITANTSGSPRAVLGVHLIGDPTEGGGLTLQHSSATLGPPAAPNQYQGGVIGLEGMHLDLGLTDTASDVLDVQVDLTLNGNAVQGTLSAR